MRVSPAVKITRCPDYDKKVLVPALTEILESAVSGGLEVKGRRLLLKPNILFDSPVEKAVTTHPALVETLAGILKSWGAEVWIGDSPGFQKPGFRGKKCGLGEAAERSGTYWADFSASKTILPTPGGKKVKKFTVTGVLEQVDTVINLPKMKTHQLMYFTGAVKNLFGLVPGLGKSPYHVMFPERNDFADMLLDLYEGISSTFSIMDGIISMEGHGPGSGSPRQTGLLLSSADAAALDLIACGLIGYEPYEVPQNRAAAERKLIPPSIDGIRIEGVPFEEAKIPGFLLIAMKKHSLNWIRLIRSQPLRGFFIKTRKKPVFSHDRCIHCGACAAICAAGALSMGKTADGRRKLTVDYSLCIRCYCCHEVCPADAIAIRGTLKK